MLYWISVGGLGLLVFLWARALFDALRDNRPEEWTLGTKTVPDPLPDPAPSLSIIVPARNEANNIEACVRSVLAVDWPGPLQMVVLDDRSTDGTGEILARLAQEDDRLLVIQGVELPEGWLGKPHALHRAQQHATGEWLMFIDADVQVDPLGPRRLIGRVISQGAEMASGLGHLIAETFWELTVQTRMGGVIAGGNPLDKVNDPEDEAALANGQCILFRRDTYDRMGGHESIKDSVLDDVDFARKAKAEQVNYRLYFAPGVFKCRMYTRFNEIWEGWTKNLFPALEYSLITTAVVTVLLFAMTLLPFVLLAKNILLALMGVPPDPLIVGLEITICALIFAFDVAAHRQHGYSTNQFWTFPLGMTIILALFWNSAWRISSGRGAVWKGRVVEAGGRPKKQG